MAEYDVGWRQRELSGQKARYQAAYAELDFLPFNGINLRLKYDFTDPDADLRDDQIYRVGVGFDLYFMPNLALTGQFRTAFATSQGADGLFIVRAWL